MSWNTELLGNPHYLNLSKQFHVLGTDLRPFLCSDQDSSLEFAWAMTQVLPGSVTLAVMWHPGAPLTSPTQAGVMGVSQSSSGQCPGTMQLPSHLQPEQGCQAETLSAQPGWLAQPAQVAPSQRGERTGNKWWLTVHTLHTWLLRQQSPAHPLTWGRLLRHRLVLSEILCIWCCSFPFSFYLVFLSFLLAPNASRDSRVPIACSEFAVQKPKGAKEWLQHAAVIQLAWDLVHPPCAFPCSCFPRRYCARDEEELGHWGSSMKSV